MKDFMHKETVEGGAGSDSHGEAVLASYTVEISHKERLGMSMSAPSKSLSCSYGSIHFLYCRQPRMLACVLYLMHEGISSGQNL